MRDSAVIEASGRVLVLAPGRDGRSACDLLARDEVDCEVCHDLDQLSSALEEGGVERCGAVLALEETFARGDMSRLSAALTTQPPWSDLPFVVLTRATLVGQKLTVGLRLPEILGNLMLLERPLHATSLRSAVRSALRGRGRQLQIRDYLLEREEAAGALRDSEALFRATTESMPQIVWAARPNGDHYFYNARWHEFTGTESGTAPVEGWIDFCHPDDRSEVQRRWRHSLETGDMYEAECRLRRVDQVWRWHLGRAVPIRHASSGHILRWLGTATEIDDQVQARQVLARSREELETLVQARTRELAATHERLHQSQKMEAVGRLTGGIAHDFNNLLTAVSGSIELIQNRTEDPRIQRLATNALLATQRGAKLTGQLLAFSRSQRLEMKAVDVNAVITGMSDILNRSIEPPVGMMLDLGMGLQSALSDANQLELAILNLAINARDAMPEGGVITLSTRLSAGAPDLDPGRYVEIAVADQGGGMTEEVRNRAFEPFFTTKGVGKGTGLGLAQVYGIARQAGGTVQIDSALDRGTTVRILLPVAPSGPVEAAVDQPRPALAGTPRRDRGTVLLVDDDDDVRRLLVDFLDTLGWRVLEASDGPHGLELLAREHPEVCILDYAMPGMNGAELARAARLVQPGLPIIFATGYAETAVLEAAREGADVLRKPFQLHELADALTRVQPH